LDEGHTKKMQAINPEANHGLKTQTT